MVLILLAALVGIKENPEKSKDALPTKPIVIIWATTLSIFILTKIFSDSGEKKGAVGN